MATNQRAKQSVLSSNSKFLAFLKNNVFILCFVITILIFLVPILKRYLDNQKLKTQENNLSNEAILSASENATNNPTLIKQKTKKIDTKYPKLSAQVLQTLKTDALKIAVALGTDVENNHRNEYVDLYNVAGWWEDEEAVIKVLKRHPGTFALLEDYYYNVFTRSRNLKTDLYKFMSPADLTEIRKNSLPYKWI